LHAADEIPSAERSVELADLIYVTVK